MTPGATEKDDLALGMLVIRLIWAAMLISLAIYIWVGYMLSEEFQVDMPIQTINLLTNILFAVSVVPLALAYVLRNRILKGQGFDFGAAGNSNFSPAVARYSVAVIISLGLSEVVGIFGFVLFLLGNNYQTLYIFMVVSAAAMIYFRPRMGELEKLHDALSKNSN